MIHFSCPKCDTRLSADPAHIGKAVACGKCKEHMIVPQPPNAVRVDPVSEGERQPTLPGKVSPMIRFSCPDCQKRLKAPNDGAGRKTHCPRCGRKLRVPSVATTPQHTNFDLPCPLAPDRHESISNPSPIAPDPFSPIQFSVADNTSSDLAEPPEASSFGFEQLGQDRQDQETSHDVEENQKQQEAAESYQSWTSRNSWWLVLAITGGCVLAFVFVLLMAVDTKTRETIFICIFWTGVISVAVTVIVLLTGTLTACPECRKWWARREDARVEIGRSGGYTTITRYDTITNARGQNIGQIARREQVYVTKVTYRHYYFCSHCNHDWTALSTVEYIG